MFTNDSFFQVKPQIPDTAQVIVVADLFVDDYVGGAELTTQALIDSSPFEIHKIRSSELTLDLIKQGVQKFWIFGNFAQMNPQLIPTIVGNLKYTVLEYDYKYCRFRSPEKHEVSTGSTCNCHEEMTGKMISAFYYGSMGLWWMSEKQKERYLKLFPFLGERTNIVLSSVFSDETLASIKLLKESPASLPKKGWIILGSDSWVKGFSSAEQYCQTEGLDYEVVWNLPYDKMLAKLAISEGLVYLPAGADTCPRFVIEGKLLGCKLHLNDNVQHKDEEWFATDDTDSIADYLYASKRLFWNGIREMMEYRPKISGYTTTFNCVNQQYPFEQCIKSMLEFCDEVCVVDGGSQDGTLEALARLKYPKKVEVGIISGSIDLLSYDRCIDIYLDKMVEEGFPDELTYSTNQFKFISDPRIKIKIVRRDWKHPRFAVFDGMQKAEARKMCTGDFCWQMDSDEIVHEDDAPKIIELCRIMPKETDILSLPVTEYWGSSNKVRLDINPAKWRLSRNRPHITHGIPRSLRRTDMNGDLCAASGTDGCDMIHAVTFEPLPHVTFFSEEAMHAQRHALAGNATALQQYEQWFNDVITNIPGVHHYSWFDIERKIRLYRDTWTHHWVSLTGADYVDTAETNMMFDCPWRDVTDEMIAEKAVELAKIGGHVWHSKLNGAQTPWITVNRKQPSVMLKGSDV